MCKKHWNRFDEHVRYGNNDIQKPFKIGIINYTGRMREMFKLDKHLNPPIRNNDD